MPHLSSLKSLTGHKKATDEDQSGDKLYDQAGQYDTEAPPPKLSVLKFEDGEQSFWQRAWEQTKEEAGVDLLVEWHIESLDLKEEVKQVAHEALLRSKDAARHERLIPGTKYTYRQLYDNVASWANKFTDVGDLIVQADPGYATLPWSMIRFAIKLSLGESETYHRMLDGTQFVARLVTQYPVIEKTYARLDSDLATALRKSLYDLYVSVLRFQISAIRYFDRNEKFFRALRGINPVSSDDIRQSREAINDFKDQVDRDIALVHSDVTKRGIDELIEGKDALLSGQKDLLSLNKDGILALSESTGASFRSQQALIEGRFDEAEAHNQKRNDAILDMWRGPLDAMSAELEKERIQREKEELLKIRQWLSTAEPETNYHDARAKRHMTLGDWLLQHQNFQKWKHNDHSALLWMYGFAGTGKTGLVCRAIGDLRERLPKGGSERLAFFFCSNDQSDSARKETYSRSDPEEALRSIVSRLSTSQRTRSAAPVVQELYKEFGPHSDQSRTLNCADCIEIVVALAREMPVTIIIDAFDELNQGRSPVLLQHLKSIIDRCPERVKVFISTRSFPAIENELNPDEAIEVTTENNGKDVRTFIQKTLQDRIDDGSLLDGKVPKQLQIDIENTLATRARNMFLYASLQLSQICDRNSNHDEHSVRKKLNNLPNNLTAVYDGIMEQIHDVKNNSERSCRLAQETFKWLLRTQTMLLCDFLLRAITPPEREATIDEILHACRTLIVKSKVLGKPVFEFAHYSVREHVSKMDEYSPSKCDLVALKGCLRVLNTNFAVPKKDEDIPEAQKIFTDYALLYWPLHYEGIDRQDMNEHRTEVNTALRNFLLQGRSKMDKYADWFAQVQQMTKRSQRDHYLSSKLDHIQATPPTALFAACVFGVDDLVGKFGRELDGLNRKNARGQTALSLAIENNKIDVVKALLSRRFPADLNLLNVSAVQQFEDFDAEERPEMIIYASALQCAAATGRLEIAEFLIDEGAHVDLVAGYYGSPLQAAALNGHSEIVSLLLRKGAEPNSQGGFHGMSPYYIPKASQSKGG